MIRIHRNHPCLFFWEPILNETNYSKEFAKKAADICKQEYPYKYNTYACDGGNAGDEYYPLLLKIRGGVKPDKTYFTREWGDNVDDWNAQNSDSRCARGWGEVPMLVQADHYANVYKGYYNSIPQMVGGCFWHSFDHQRGYHADPFYGGIMDAFRQPKTAYYMFMSQRENVKSDIIAETGPMIYIANEMTPFSPDDVTIYSNCDEVRLTVFKGGKVFHFIKDKTTDKKPSPVIVFKNAFDKEGYKKLTRSNKQDECYLLAEGLIDGKVVATDKRYPVGQAYKIRLRLDNDGTNLMANGSDIVTVIAEIVDKRGFVKRLNNSIVKFSIEGEGRLLANEQTSTNPISVSWGSAPVLVQSTEKVGVIKITASLQQGGIRRPLEGELIFNSVPDSQREIYSSADLKSMAHIQGNNTINTVGKTELERENERLKKEINDLKVKSTEKQQTQFGIGIND